MQRIVACVSVAFALIVMANVFNPGDSHASEGDHGHDATHGDAHHHDGGTDEHGTTEAHDDHAEEEVSHTLSTGEQLFFMGALENHNHTIELYVCNGDLRYSVVNNASGETELAYATRADVMALLPHVHLPNYAETTGTTQIMHAGDAASIH